MPQQYPRLGQEFFIRDVLTVAPELLGKTLVRNYGDSLTALPLLKWKPTGVKRIKLRMPGLGKLPGTASCMTEVVLSMFT